MFILVILAILSLIGIGTTIAALRNDGYGRTRTDWRRLP